MSINEAINIQTTSINAIAPTTGNISIGASQTTGILNVGTGTGRTATGVINIGNSTGVAPIYIETGSTLNSNANPAIAIGTSGSTKTIKIGSNSNSVHCSSIDLQGSAINNITATTGAISIGNNQTTGALNIGCKGDETLNGRTIGVIHIGSDLSQTAQIRLGNNAAITPVVCRGSFNCNRFAQFDTSLTVNSSLTSVGNTTLAPFTGSGALINILSAGSTLSGSVINMYTGATSAGTVNIATGTGATQTTVVNIGSGDTTGAVTIGNPSNTVQVKGTLAMGTGKNITLQGNTSWTAPISTQLGYSIPISNPTFSGTVTTGGTATAYSVGTFLEKGTYIVSLYAFGFYGGTVTSATLNFLIGIISSATSTPSGTTTLFNTTTGPIKVDTASTTGSTIPYFPTYVITVVTPAYYFGLCSAGVTIVGGGTAEVGCQMTGLARIA